MKIKYLGGLLQGKIKKVQKAIFNYKQAHTFREKYRRIVSQKNERILSLARLITWNPKPDVNKREEAAFHEETFDEQKERKTGIATHRKQTLRSVKWNIEDYEWEQELSF